MSFFEPFEILTKAIERSRYFKKKENKKGKEEKGGGRKREKACCGIAHMYSEVEAGGSGIQHHFRLHRSLKVAWALL